MMALVVLVAMPLGWLVNGAREQREAVAAIGQAGGGIIFDWQANSRVFAPVSPRGPRWLREILGPDYFDNVVYVNLYPNRIDDPRSLDDAGFAKLAEHLKRLPRLTSINLNWSRITGASLTHFGDLRALEDLWICGTHADDSDFEQLARCHSLKAIRLRGCPIGDGAVRHLAKMPNLEVLSLTQTKVTDACLDDLAGMRKLKFLFIGLTSITPEGIAFLKARLPGVEISTAD
jgi:Leucine Rich repeat